MSSSNVTAHHNCHGNNFMMGVMTGSLLSSDDYKNTDIIDHNGEFGGGGASGSWDNSDSSSSSYDSGGDLSSYSDDSSSY